VVVVAINAGFRKDDVRVIADLEIHLLLPGIGLHVQVFIEHAVTVAVGARFVVVGAHGGADFVHFQKAAHHLVTGIHLQHAIGAGPVLDVAADLVLLLLRAGTQQYGDG